MPHTQPKVNQNQGGGVKVEVVGAPNITTWASSLLALMLDKESPNDSA